MYDAAVTGTDAETGYLILTDGTLFDPDYYARNNPDVVDQFGPNPEDLLAHYLTYGKNENRAPSEKVAKTNEEKFLAFAKMLDEDAAAKKAASEAAEAAKYAQAEKTNEDNGGAAGTAVSAVSNTQTASASGGGGATGTTGTIDSAGGVFINGVAVGHYYAGGYYTADPLPANAVITIPMSLTDSNNTPVNVGWSNVDWASCSLGSAQSVTFQDSVGNVVTVGSVLVNGTTYNAFTLTQSGGQAVTYSSAPGYPTLQALTNALP